jgi:hypothetical protein
MLATIPAAKLAGSQLHAVAEGAKATALTAKVQEYAIQLLNPATTGGASLIESRLTVDVRHDGSLNRKGLSRRLCSDDTPMRQPVSRAVSRPVPLQDEVRQGFKAYCLGHCLARCLALS